MGNDAPYRTPEAGIRLDVWLDIACLFRTRSEAQRACRNGKIDVNGTVAKPRRDVRAGDTLRIGRPLGRTQTVVVKGLADRHMPKAEARPEYERLHNEIKSQRVSTTTTPTRRR